MGLLERVQDAMQPQAAWPVGPGEVSRAEEEYGHFDALTSDDFLAHYLAGGRSHLDKRATSNQIFSVAMLRARLMASLSLRLFDNDGPEKQEITEGAEYDLLRHVNPFWTRRRLGMMDELSMCVWGKTAWAVEKQGRTPKEIWWVKPSRLRPVPDRDNYLRGYVYEATTGDRIPFKPDEIVWFRYPNPDDEFSALSPLLAARLAADTGQAMMESNRNLFRNGMQLGGVVVPTTDKVTFSQEQAAELEDLLTRRFRGRDKAHRWAVLRYEAQFKGLNVTPKDAEFTSGLNLTLREVCNAYGVPVTLLNDLQNATLSNAREHKLLLWEHALMPDAMLKAEEIVEQLLPMFGPRGRVRHVAWDTSQVPALQQAESESWIRERQAIEVGALTINEWRKSKGMPPVLWGDVFWLPLHKVPVADPEDVELEDRDGGGNEGGGNDEPTREGDPAPAAGSRLVPIKNADDFWRISGLPPARALNGHEG